MSLEVEDQITCNLATSTSKKVTNIWGIGRHILGSQIFDYWFDPYDFRVEHWTDGDLLNAATPAGTFPASEALNVQWGSDASSRVS